ncbi:HigA family addiction module antitoxin [Anaerococcus lactolyticus]|uniref:HTH cro/C1-type domain-containing protein n=1 Tax=Anaerococcus lactolyticus S7-1-13 TaxID=1284686 RepID=A0A095X0P7_9FIRM|nr:HigA family addiction module antitoxin [Anaerococcus lactolyticus]KGF03403.1 hypothetical protein HMPREF1630_07430 [Anaerococcus lactolyticus S7-1-13]
MSNNIVSYENLIAFHPGSYIEDIIDDLNLSQDEFARRMDVSAKTVSKIINGKSRVTNELAEKLDRFTGISYDTWIKLQSSYDQKIIEINDTKSLDEEKRIARLIDFKYFKRDLPILADKNYSVLEKVEFLRRFFNISNLKYLRDFNSNVSYRNKQIMDEFNENSVIKSNIMLEIAINIARDKADKSLNLRKLNDSFGEIKTLISDINCYDRLSDILYECGIILVTLPYLSGSNLNGAVYKFANGSVLLLISDKQKKRDIFWFTLMHELGHILNKDFDSNLDKKEYECREVEADKFAQNFLIDPVIYNKFKNNGRFDRLNIENFARENSIGEDIIVGRLKYDESLEQNIFNDYNREVIFPRIDSTLFESI